MIGWEEIEKALPTLRHVDGGFSEAQRGIVTLADGQTVFVKIGIDERTLRHAQAEIRAYHWLEGAGYQHAPRLLAESDKGFALPDLSAWDWEHVWHAEKVDTALLALDRLAALPSTTGHFEQADFLGVGNPWHDVPRDANVYGSFIGGDVLGKLSVILTDEGLRREYANVAEKHPWKGDQLVHYDARADNFAYDHASGHGFFVDWNYMALGNTAFDRTAMLVNVQLSGFDVLSAYRDQIDRDSLIWLMGLWLARALGPQDTARLKKLRPRQVVNALVCQDILAKL